MSDITIKDIARECGVGVSTVSRAINNHPDINPETRNRIMKVIREKGYVPNDSARYLKRSETNNIALLVKGISNQFFTDIIQEIEKEVEEHSYALILRHVSAPDDEVLTAQALVKERKLKGIIFLGGNFTHDEAMLEQVGVPFVFATVGEDPKEADSIEQERSARKIRYANIAVDDVQASFDAAEYLIQLGHEKIGLVAEGIEIPSIGQLRYRGFCRALQQHGIEFQEDRVYDVKEGIEHFSFSNGYHAAKELLNRCPDLTAIFCFSDVLAMGAARAIMDSNREIPEDVSLLGFDGIEMGEYMNPRLSTMSQPSKEIADEAVHTLFGMIEDEEKPVDRIMNAKLTVRESTGKVMHG